MKKLSCLVVLLIAFFPAAGAEKRQKPGAAGTQSRSVFDMPALQKKTAAYNLNVIRLMRAGRLREAEQAVRAFVERFPDAAGGHYNLACVLARQGRKKEALDTLSTAIDKGFRNRQHITADDDLKSLREEPAFKALLEKTGRPADETLQKKVPAGPVKDGAGVVEEHNTRWLPQLAMFVTAFAAPPTPADDAPVVTGHGKAGDLVRGWWKEKTAAGNHGDFYDNHDGDHSNLAFKKFPQFTRIEYGEAAKKRKLNTGLQQHFIFNRTTIGNSSTAVTSGWVWRSQPRMAMVNRHAMNAAAFHYRRNHLYFYPEHRDYDEKNGDVFPANHPYHVISQGSSGSDRPFMDAAACILAAFRPETKQRLRREGLLMPVVQMILRRGMKGIDSDEDYLSGAAHPVVFNGKRIVLDRMVTLAHEITPEAPPPLPVLALRDFRPAAAGREMIAPPNSEILVMTPQAIGLVYRRTAGRWRFTAAVKAVGGPDTGDVEVAWRVLQGDPEKITVETSDGGTTARITVPWFERFPVRPDSRKMTGRVDIGCFVKKGPHWSAPAIISVCASARESRVYRDDGKIARIDYNGHPERYDDPLVFPGRFWRDEFTYTADGALTGWTRKTSSNDRVSEYTRHGMLVDTTDDRGRPLRVRPVQYRTQVSGKKGPVTTPVPADRHGYYTYAGPEDILGKLQEKKPGS